MLNPQSILKDISPQSQLQDLSTEVAKAVYDRLLADSAEDHARPNAQAKHLDARTVTDFGSLTHGAHFSRLHEPILSRNPKFVLAVAEAVFDDNGDFNDQAIEDTFQALMQHAYCIEPYSYYESEARQHVLNILDKLKQKNGSLRQALLTFPLDSNNHLATRRVKETLGLTRRTALRPRDIRIAMLSVTMSYFRQNVGSCFATAPAIVIQRYCPELMIQDWQSFFDRGRLDRYFAGEGIEVPMNQSVGVGDFKRPLALAGRSIESLLISFAASPALEAALLAANILTEKKPAQRAQQVVFWLKPVVAQFISESETKPEALSIEQLLKWIALRAFMLTEEVLERFKRKPQPMIRDGVILRNVLQDDTDYVCEECLEALSQMITVFKRFGENPLLKTWEYTLASLTDHQSVFTNSNLYHSLGMHPNQPHGVGAIIELAVRVLLDRFNAEAKEATENYNHIVAHMRQMEMRFNTLPRSAQASLQMEYANLQSKLLEIGFQAQQASQKAEYVSGLFNRLINRYLEWFSRYFQEIYDPDLHTHQQVRQYDDAPAGFRLYFKHSSSDTGRWEPIASEQQFLDALCEFFRSTETLLMGEIPDDLQDIAQLLVSQILQHLREPAFMEHAAKRLKSSGLDQSHNGTHTPWAYVSGGYVDSLLGAYFRLDGSPKTERIAIANPEQLFERLIQHVRSLPLPHERMEHSVFAKERVICSASHAFVLQHYREPFTSCWEQGVDSWRWLQVNLLEPSLNFFEQNHLPPEQQDYLLKVLQKKYQFPFDLTAVIKRGKVSTKQLTDRLLSMVPETFHPNLIMMLASSYYQHLPLLNRRELLNAIAAIGGQLGMAAVQIQSLVENLLSRLPPQPYYGSEMMQKLLLMCVMLTENALFSSRNWQVEIAQTARALGFSPPMPLLFADTNWMGYEFGFALNPATCKLDVWQCDGLGHNAQPWPLGWGGEWLFFTG